MGKAQEFPAEQEAEILTQLSVKLPAGTSKDYIFLEISRLFIVARPLLFFRA